jgi:hypothetical protein
MSWYVATEMVSGCHVEQGGKMRIDKRVAIKLSYLHIYRTSKDSRLASSHGILPSRLLFAESIIDDD